MVMSSDRWVRLVSWCAMFRFLQTSCSPVEVVLIRPGGAFPFTPPGYVRYSLSPNIGTR